MSIRGTFMGAGHTFIIDDLSVFITALEARHYRLNESHPDSASHKIYSKLISGALWKHYGFSSMDSHDGPASIRVTYRLVQQGIPLNRLATALKKLNYRYRQTLPGWKTKRESGSGVRQRRWQEVQQFLHRHGELIACFQYNRDDRLTEGNRSFNVEIASTPREQLICFNFIKGLVEASSPEGIVRGRRGVDKSAQQRNGWIRRFARAYRKRGWTPRDIVREAQKELREGTWNERSKLQFNLSPITISKIAGVKLTASASS